MKHKVGNLINSILSECKFLPDKFVLGREPGNCMLFYDFFNTINIIEPKWTFDTRPKKLEPHRSVRCDGVEPLVPCNFEPLEDICRQKCRDSRIAAIVVAKPERPLSLAQ